MMNGPQHSPYRSKRSSLVTLAVAAVCSAGTTQLAAQELEEITVTATKRAQSLQDVPIAVTALGGDELSSIGVDSQRTLSMVTPNVAVNVNASFIAPYVRGVGTQYANPGLEPSVATYFNDAYISRPSAGFMQFADVERVEVLKGPQGTLYGRNTTGGAIRIITKDPTEEFDAKVGLTFGRYNDKVIDGYVSGPIGASVKGRLSAQWEERDPWVKNIAGGADLEDRKIYMVHGKLLFEPSENLRIKLSGDYTKKDDREGIDFQSLFTGIPGQTGAAFGGLTSRYGTYSGNVQKDKGSDLTQHFKANGGELRIDYDLGRATFSSITAYRYTFFNGVADLDGTNVPFLEGQTVYDDTKDWSQEFQLVSNGEGRVNYVAGVYYLKEKAKDNFGFTGLALGGLTNFTGGDGKIDIKSLAPYGELTFKASDQWELLVGARYTDEKKEVSNDFYIAPNTGRTGPIMSRATRIPAPNPNGNNTFKFSKVTPKVQATWRPRERTMFYLTYSEGIKSGGFNMPSPSPAPVTKVNNEKLKSVELGWKTEFGRLRFNGALFHYDITDLQVQVTDLSGGITAVKNAGDASVDGLEADLTFAATDRLTLDAGFGWQDAKFKSVPGGNYNPLCADQYVWDNPMNPRDAQCVALGGLGLATVVRDLKGNELPHAPEFTAYGRFNYELPLGANGKMNFGLVGSYSAEFSYTPDNLYKEPSKFLANANVGWSSSDDKYALGAFVNNLTDEEYYTHSAPLSATGGWKVPAMPRTYGIRAAVKF